jgi:hypothetical protein
MPLYVAGPVLRSPAQMLNRPDWRTIYENIGSPEFAERRMSAQLDFITDVYSGIMRSAVQFNMRLFLPQPDPDLEASSPAEFTHQIISRIGESDRVICVYTPFDASGPVETAYASTLGKKILIVAQLPSLLPRIMLGLPGLRGVVEYRSTRGFLSQLAEFLRR